MDFFTIENFTPMLNLRSVEYTMSVHKKKGLYKLKHREFIDITCPGCSQVTVCYSHSQTDISCKECSIQFLKSTGGKAKLLRSDLETKKSENKY